ncbi:MAG: hypothetical protein J7L66_01325, partial [Anaerolineaceae bacterium]|nr:hypothetical protein [Anaerolineaceae bacterium]
PVSDSVMAYILAFSRKQPWLDASIKKGDWEKIPGKSLMESTLGVIGVGNIGKAVLKKAHAFDMRLIATDIIDISEIFTKKYNVKMVDLITLVRQADFISINCDLNPTSFHLINEKIFSAMKPSAVVINTARGPIIEQRALITALKTHRIAGAALDVFEVEPIPADSPLLAMDQVMLAPHNANSSPLAWEAVHWNTIKNLLIGLKMSLDTLEAIQKEKMGKI